MATEMRVFDNKDEWLKHRKKIGGSDAGVILGLSKWKDNLTLYREKLDLIPTPDLSDNPLVQYGIRTEPLIRAIVINHHPEWSVGYFENNIISNTKYPFAHASLDGWIEDSDGRKGVLEIKTAELSSKLKSEEWADNHIPDTYFAQLLHYMMVTEFDFAILCAELKTYRADGSVEWRIIERRIDRSEVEEDIKYLEEKEREFWKCLQERREPGRKLPSI